MKKTSLFLTALLISLFCLVLVGCSQECQCKIYVQEGLGTIAVGEHSTNTQSTVAVTLKKNRTITFTATPTNGNKIKNWICNGEVVNNQGSTFTVVCQEPYTAEVGVAFEPVSTKKLVLLLIDGLRPDAIANLADTLELQQKSTYCMSGRTVMPSVTLPCHLSLFHSVTPDVHGTLSNDYSPNNPQMDSLADILAAAGKKCSMVYDWQELGVLGKQGTFEKIVFNNGDELGYENTAETNLQRAKEILTENTMDFMFLYFGMVDEIGHYDGWMSESYLTAAEHCIAVANRLVQQFGDEYAFVITADHGGHDYGHGTETTEDMTIPVFFVGDGFEQGKVLQSISILDLAPTIAKYLGLTIPTHWQGHSII